MPKFSIINLPEIGFAFSIQYRRETSEQIKAFSQRKYFPFPPSPPSPETLVEECSLPISLLPETVLMCVSPSKAQEASSWSHWRGLCSSMRLGRNSEEGHTGRQLTTLSGIWKFKAHCFVVQALCDGGTFWDRGVEWGWPVHCVSLKCNESLQGWWSIISKLWNATQCKGKKSHKFN